MVEKRAKTAEQTIPSAHLIVDDRADAGHVDPDQERDLLATRLRNGDRAAATRLVDMYYKQMYLFMRRLGHDEQTSEDLTQECFLNAWYHIGQLRDGKALNSWLYRIAVNVSKLYWRKHKGREAKQIENLDVRADDRTSLDRAGQAEQVERLRAHVADLPMKLRQAIVLHYIQHLTIAEAAAAAGLRQGTFKSRLNRALRALRKQMVQKPGERQ